MSRPNPRRPVTPELVAKIRKLRAEGLTVPVITERMGLNKRVVQAALKKDEPVMVRTE